MLKGSVNVLPMRTIALFKTHRINQIVMMEEKFFH